MSVITAITAQKRKQDRVNIFLDETYAFSLAAITAAPLRAGQTLSEEEITHLRLADEFERAKDAAMRLISQRPRSVHEVRQRLRRREFAAESIEKALDRLQDLGLLDDEQFARYWVDQRNTFKPRSPRALRQELMQKGVAREIIDTAVSTLDEEHAARRAAASRAGRWSALPEDEFRHKLRGFLQRRGFGYEITRKITDELWQAHLSEEEGDSS